MTLDGSDPYDDIVTVDGIRVCVEAGLYPYAEDNIIDLVEIVDERRLITADPALI